jgi:hypothetical protein
LEAAVDRYRLQEEEWQTKLNQSDGQARVILVMSEQVYCPLTVPLHVLSESGSHLECAR